VDVVDNFRSSGEALSSEQVVDAAGREEILNWALR
jgi:hypothetical protein